MSNHYHNNYKLQINTRNTRFLITKKRALFALIIGRYFHTIVYARIICYYSYITYILFYIPLSALNELTFDERPLPQICYNVLIV